MRILSKMNPGDITSPVDALKEASVADTDTKTEVMLGSIIGMATGLSYRKNNFGDGPSVALTGMFEAIPSDPKKDGARSPSLFMPQSVQAMLVQAMLDGTDEAPVTKMPKQGERIDVQTGKTLKILFQVAVRRNAAVGGAGYEFVVSHAGETEKIDILEQLRVELQGGKAMQLATSDIKKLSVSGSRAPHNVAKKAAKKKAK